MSGPSAAALQLSPARPAASKLCFMLLLHCVTLLHATTTLLHATALRYSSTLLLAGAPRTAVLSLWDGFINKRERATCALPSHFHSCSVLAQIASDPAIIQGADGSRVQNGTQMMSADNSSLSGVPACLLNACGALILMSLCRDIVPQFGK